MPAGVRCAAPAKRDLDDGITPQPSTNGNSEPPPALYRACPTKRVRRTKADIDVVKQAILDVIGADPPMTVRQVFYQLVARGVIEKTERNISRPSFG
jgi:hypothetical protein